MRWSREAERVVLLAEIATQWQIIDTSAADQAFQQAIIGAYRLNNPENRLFALGLRNASVYIPGDEAEQLRYWAGRILESHEARLAGDPGNRSAARPRPRGSATAVEAGHAADQTDHRS